MRKYGMSTLIFSSVQIIMRHPISMQSLKFQDTICYFRMRKKSYFTSTKNHNSTFPSPVKVSETTDPGLATARYLRLNSQRWGFGSFFRYHVW